MRAVEKPTKHNNKTTRPHTDPDEDRTPNNHNNNNYNQKTRN